MSEALRAAAVNIEKRIAEIDALLAETQALRAEREHLARALEEVPAVTGATAPAPPAAPRRGATPRRSSSEGRKRAPQGLNRERIVAFLRDNGPTSASAIARGTGINRAVVYNNLSRLT